MMQGKFNKTERRGLPGGPNEQFTYVTGVFQQDMYHVPKAQLGLSHRDSVAHQADKIVKYEQVRGGPGGIPLPQYSDPKYMSMLMDDIFPEVSKIMPKASAMEKAEAMDFIFNSGWNKDSKTIKRDPRAYALQEYYKKYDRSKLDADSKWAGRRGAPYSFDEEYANTIGKLSENERRVLMNRGRDWYYQNINVKPDGSPNDNYYDTWYGRIWNTNDFSEFNPNNPLFKYKKKYGGKVSTQGYKRNSPDVGNSFNVIPSGNITMKDVDFPVHGVDNLGNQQMMYPGGEYQFPGDMVYETPLRRAQQGMQTKTSTAQNIWKDLNKAAMILSSPHPPTFAKAAINKRIYDSVTPIPYDVGHALKEIIAGKKLPFVWDRVLTSFDDFDIHPRFGKSWGYKGFDEGQYIKETSQEAFDKYLKPEKKDFKHISPAQYRPTTNKGEDIEYMQFNRDRDIWYTARNQDLRDAKIGTNKQIKDSGDGGFALKDYTLSRGKDDKGHYISYWDRNDYSPSVMGIKVPVEKFVGKPYDFYGRMYFDPDTGKRTSPKEIPTERNIDTRYEGKHFRQEGGSYNFDNLVKKYTTQGWPSLNAKEQQFYRDRYNQATMDSEGTYIPRYSLPAVTVNPYADRIPGKDITREGVMNTMGSAGKALGKTLSEFTGIPAATRISKDPKGYLDAGIEMAKDVATLNKAPDMSNWMKMLDVAELTPMVGMGAKAFSKGAKITKPLLTENVIPATQNVLDKILPYNLHKFHRPDQKEIVKSLPGFTIIKDQYIPSTLGKVFLGKKSFPKSFEISAKDAGYLQGVWDPKTKTYGLNTSFDNPFTAGKAFHTMNDLLTKKSPAILEKTSVSLDALPGVLKNRKGWKSEFFNHIPLNDMAVFNKAAGADLKTQMKVVNKMLSDTGKKEKAYIKGDEIMVPNYVTKRDYAKGGSINLDPAKKGTFKALATRYGMSMDKLAMDMKKNPDKYSPGARKKANFYRNFVMQQGGSTNNKQFEIYQNYINGVFDEVSEEEAEKVYDKLNRIYYAEAKKEGMFPANYIMTHIIQNV